MLNKKRLIENFLKLLSIYSPSKNERQIADHLIKYLHSLGLEVNEDQAGESIGGNCGNLYFKIPATNPKFAPIAFFAHLDTVKATVGINAKITDNWIKTDGTTILGADDKAGLAIILELVHQLREQSVDHGGIEIIFTVAEESGLEGAKHFDIKMLEAKLGFVLDSGDNVGSFVVKAPAEYDTTIEVYGKSAHAGVEPEKGLNAIFLAAEGLVALPRGRIDEETTFNIGIISGGESTNIVPDFVRLQGELRSLNEQKADSWIKEIKSIFETKIQQLGGKSQLKYNKIYSSFDISQNKNFKKIISLAAQKIGVCPRGVSRGGGSDANILNEKGLPTTNLGLGMKEEHTYKEKIAINDLVKGGELVLAIVQSLAKLTDE
jgi:tripeptide aminopeptidase